MSDLFKEITKADGTKVAVNISKVCVVDDGQVKVGDSYISLTAEQVADVKQAVDDYSAGGDTDEAYKEGYSDGETAGYKSGYSEGYDIGEDAGETTGYNKGYTEGYEKGKEEGGEQLPYQGLCFTANTAGSTIAQNIGKDGCTYQTSTDGSSWSTYTLGTVITLTNEGDKVYWKGDGMDNTTTDGDPIFVMTGSIAASGSAMSLIDGLGVSKDMTGNTFISLFRKCDVLTSAPEFPATVLTNKCYHSLFRGCSALTTAPELPATDLKPDCYQFAFCTCTSLTTPPALPATTLVYYSYYYMFYGCSALTYTPTLPATTLAESCCGYMFSHCTNLVTVSPLPATTLASNCYNHMLDNCKALESAPEIFATEFAYSSCGDMLYSCSNLKYVKVHTTSWNTSNSSWWMDSVGSGGVFVKPTECTIPTSISGIPSGWTTVNI